MEKAKKNIGAQIYGYTVCLVAVITFLISVTSMVSAVIDRSDPLHSGWTAPGTPSLASFENYKMDMLKSSQKGDESSTTAGYVPDDQTLKVMYEAARQDKIQTVQHNSKKAIIVGSLSIFIAVILFFTHWRWMRSLGKTEG